MTRYLGVDYGTKRVGLAISDGVGLTARPLEVVPRNIVVERVRELDEEYTIKMVIVGLPTGLSGEEGVSAVGARALGKELLAATGIPVDYLDERFTSKLAEDVLLQSGMKRRQRRETVDKVAAAIILQDYLDVRAADGNHETG
ncbi:MAG: Holliday junction resolvase RuvX [Acidimicrobiia bacterium]